MSYAKAKANHESGSGGGGGDGTVLQSLMCSAHGCPNRWSTSMGHVCRWHADADPERWPEVTQQQQWDETERARLRNEPKPPEGRRFTDPVRMREAFRRFAQRLRDRDLAPKRWAHRLKAREDGGEKLGPIQREAWRTALHHLDIPEDVPHDA